MSRDPVGSGARRRLCQLAPALRAGRGAHRRAAGRAADELRREAAAGRDARAGDARGRSPAADRRRPARRRARARPRLLLRRGARRAVSRHACGRPSRSRPGRCGSTSSAATCRRILPHGSRASSRTWSFVDLRPERLPVRRRRPSAAHEHLDDGPAGRTRDPARRRRGRSISTSTCSCAATSPSWPTSISATTAIAGRDSIDEGWRTGYALLLERRRTWTPIVAAAFGAPCSASGTIRFDAFNAGVLVMDLDRLRSGRLFGAHVRLRRPLWDERSGRAEPLRPRPANQAARGMEPLPVAGKLADPEDRPLRRAGEALAPRDLSSVVRRVARAPPVRPAGRWRRAAGRGPGRGPQLHCAHEGKLLLLNGNITRR